MNEMKDIDDRLPGGPIAEALGPGPAVQWLFNFARGAPERSPLQRTMALISRTPDPRRSAIDALLAWKVLFARERNSGSLLELDRAGEILGVPGLRLHERVPLRCDPLGDVARLSAEWHVRIDLLREAVSGH